MHMLLTAFPACYQFFNSIAGGFLLVSPLQSINPDLVVDLAGIEKY
jgi:hypothetical protein